MKAILYDSSGKKKSEFSLPALFDSKIREDMVAKFFEVAKFSERQVYGPSPEGGKRHSASGTISHKRKEWKGHYGKGMARLPRKTMWRRGTQFHWIGAEVSQARGGRMAHPPKRLYAIRKINKKEIVIAVNSALASTFNKEYIAKRYSTLNVPAHSQVIESIPAKTKNVIEAVKLMFGEAFSLLIKSKQVRPGKGKNRGRKYKSNAGLLIVTGEDEKVNAKGFEVKTYSDLLISDLYPLGRLTLYTKKAMEEIAEEKNA
ncbi:MAG: 50S ribosomal protein L4 [Nanoarchaeota archaeon]